MKSTLKNYRIHGNTVFIEGNGIIGHYLVHGNKVKKIIQHYSGDELVQDFHTFGDLPTNLEAELLNELREEGLV